MVVALVRGDPNAPPDDGVVRIDTGPSIIEVLAAGATLPVLCLLLLSVSALWWLRLPVDFEAPDEEPDPSVRRPRRWRPAPAPDANVDDLTLDGVELIEPVERLHPRDERRRRIDAERLRRLLPPFLGRWARGRPSDRIPHACSGRVCRVQCAVVRFVRLAV